MQYPKDMENRLFLKSASIQLLVHGELNQG